MAWGKIDDNFAFHPKVIEVGNDAIGLWTRALSYSCQQLTDGFIPHGIVTALGDSGDAADRLVQVGLWLDADGGYQFHQWNEYQPSAAEVRARRSEISAKRAQAGAKGMSSRWNNKPDNKPITNGITNALQTDNPEPVPEPVPDTTSKDVVLTRKKIDEGKFEQFWSVWPKRVGKGSARAAWVKAVKRVEPDVLIAAAKAYAEWSGLPEMQFIPMPATWLNGERWLDDLPVRSVVRAVVGLQSDKSVYCIHHYPVGQCEKGCAS